MLAKDLIIQRHACSRRRHRWTSLRRLAAHSCDDIQALHCRPVGMLWGDVFNAIEHCQDGHQENKNSVQPHRWHEFQTTQAAQRRRSIRGLPMADEHYMPAKDDPRSWLVQDNHSLSNMPILFDMKIFAGMTCQLAMLFRMYLIVALGQHPMVHRPDG